MRSSFGDEEFNVVQIFCRKKCDQKGHDHLLESQLLEKSARHNFIIARHRSSNNIFSCQLLESS